MVEEKKLKELLEAGKRNYPVSLKTQVAKVAIASLAVWPIAGSLTAFAVPSSNQEPVLTKPINYFTLLPGQEKALNLNDYFTDPDADPLTYYYNDDLFNFSSPVTAYVYNDQSSPQVRIGLQDFTGTEAITIHANASVDDGGLSANTEFTYQVGRVVANSPSQKKLLPVNGGFTIDPAGLFQKDSALGDLSYEIYGFNTGVVSHSSGTLTISALPDQIGTTTVTLKASSGGYSATTDYEVTIDTAPEIIKDIPHQYLEQGQVNIINLNEFFNDSDIGIGDHLAFDVVYDHPEGSPVGAYLDSGSTNLMYLYGDKLGTASFTVTATDNIGGKVSMHFDASVGKKLLQTGQALDVEAYYSNQAVIIPVSEDVNEDNIHSYFNNDAYVSTNLVGSESEYTFGTLNTEHLPAGSYKVYLVDYYEEGVYSYYYIDNVYYYDIVSISRGSDTSLDIGDILSYYIANSDINDDGNNDANDLQSLMKLTETRKVPSHAKLYGYYGNYYEVY